MMMIDVALCPFNRPDEPCLGDVFPPSNRWDEHWTGSPSLYRHRIIATSSLSCTLLTNHTLDLADGDEDRVNSPHIRSCAACGWGRRGHRMTLSAVTNEKKCFCQLNVTTHKQCTYILSDKLRGASNSNLHID